MRMGHKAFEQDLDQEKVGCEPLCWTQQMLTSIADRAVEECVEGTCRDGEVKDRLNTGLERLIAPTACVEVNMGDGTGYQLSYGSESGEAA